MYHPGSRKPRRSHSLGENSQKKRRGKRERKIYQVQKKKKKGRIKLEVGGMEQGSRQYYKGKEKRQYRKQEGRGYSEAEAGTGVGWAFVGLGVWSGDFFLCYPTWLGVDSKSKDMRKPRHATMETKMRRIQTRIPPNVTRKSFPIPTSPQEES